MVPPAKHQLGRHRGGFRPARLRFVWFALAVVLAATAVEAEVRGIRLCADPSNLPFSSKDPGAPGFEVEIAQAIAQELGAHFSVHWFPTFRGFLALRQLHDGKCDLFMGLPLTERFARDNPRLIFSVPYYVMGQALVSPGVGAIRTPEEVKRKLVGVQAMTLSDELVFQRGYTRRIYLTPEETFVALTKGEVDAVVMASSLAGWMVKNHPGFRLTWLREPEHEFTIGAGMRKADRALKDAVDRALRQLDRNKLTQILARYGVPTPPPTQGATPSPHEMRHGRASGARWKMRELPARVIGRLDLGKRMPPLAEYVLPRQAVAQEAKALPPDLREGRSMFFTSCSECHGVDAKGTPMAANLVTFKGTDEDFVKIVQKGRAGTAMLPWKGILSEDEIGKIRAYIKSLSKQ